MFALRIYKTANSQTLGGHIKGADRPLYMRSHIPVPSKKPDAMKDNVLSELEV